MPERTDQRDAIATALAAFATRPLAEAARGLSETLYGDTHSLRIALAKLQTLDTVRIIGGKA